MDPANRRIVVLGGTSGIGFAVAQKAAYQGAAVVIASSKENNVNRARKLLFSLAEGLTLDLTSEENIKSFFGKIGELDHLVCAAGESLLAEPLETVSLERARKFFDIRFWGAFLALKYGVPPIRRGGSVVLTSGMASRRPLKGRSMASSVCGSAEALTRSLAVELAPLRVNLVCLGLVKTGLWDGRAAEARETIYRRSEQIGRFLRARRLGRGARLFDEKRVQYRSDRRSQRRRLRWLTFASTPRAWFALASTVREEPSAHSNRRHNMTNARQWSRQRVRQLGPPKEIALLLSRSDGGPELVSHLESPSLAQPEVPEKELECL